MAKTLKQIKENLRLVDFVIEVLDARIPRSSSNPELEKLIPAEKRIIALNKSDLADSKTTNLWIEYYKGKSISGLAVDSLRGNGVKELLAEISALGIGVMEKWKRRGRIKKQIRVMIVGIPNVGKSSLINRITRKGTARTGDKPGVTRGKQWIKVTDRIDLLDTPGILWPKFRDEEVGINLAITGAIKEEIIDREALAIKLIDRLMVIDPFIIGNYYGIENMDDTSYGILEQVGSVRGCLLKGGKVDTLRALGILLDDYRTGKLGKISLESPESTWD
jgi:ribosome biogenesis GTPase A